MSYTEDDLTNALIDYYQEEGADTIEAEAPYNHYGDRGVVDLFITGHDYPFCKLLEVKSGSAIREGTGANEISRQFNKMKRYFFKDESRSIPSPSREGTPRISFELCFLPSEETFEHVHSNAAMYEAAIKDGEEYVDFYDATTECRLSFRHPDEPIPPVVVSSSSDHPTQYPPWVFERWDVIENNNGAIYHTLEEPVKNTFEQESLEPD